MSGCYPSYPSYPSRTRFTPVHTALGRLEPVLALGSGGLYLLMMAAHLAIVLR
jgi:hypothetical protein